MIPLKIAILWHQHQPYYKINGKYRLPWVRLHGIKDYYDLPALFYNYPEIKQTINIVPSMIMQVEDYAANDVNEKILNLTRKKAAELNDDDKKEILNSFFICNETNMLRPYPRFAELFDRARSSGIRSFGLQDWLDLQVWYNLTWFGQISRQRSEIKYLFLKERNFSEEDKELLLKTEKDILSDIIPVMQRLRDLGNLEISVSPMFHPILPLISDTDTAAEAMPGNELPRPPFRYPQDAEWHLNEAVNFYTERFGKIPAGLWPSEGSVSDEALDLIAQAGFKWLATDEGIMTASFKTPVNRLERFFPRRFETGKGELIIFFRDRLLSDLIGFNYANMQASEAATDFINRLKYVRWEISSQYGEESLRHAVVPVILDGENCWEFYKDNGKPFLDALFSGLSDEPELRTVTFSEASNENSANYLKPMNHVRAGSWINANFDIWIGQKEHVNAWNALREARETIEKTKGTAKAEDLKAAIDEIHIAEGSDWFWWYHDAHQAPNKHDFDIMFRELLKNVYTFLGLTAPAYLDKPFGKGETPVILTQPANKISPDTSAYIKEQWQGAGIYNAGSAMDAMHSASDIISKLLFGNDENYIYFRIETKRKIEEGESIEIKIAEPFEYSKVIDNNSSTAGTQKGFVFTVERQKSQTLKLLIKATTQSGMITYPRSGLLELKLID
jgi:alpha-amylase/alpha-mannosidase (GH57 family)